MINVTKAFLPPLSEYTEILKEVWDNNILTNRGPMALKLESELSKRFDQKNCLFVSNGTIALQLAIQALELKGEVITTPFSYVATTSSLLWESIKPVFVDIDPISLCINPELIEQAITPSTSAILATHVFGNPCDVEALDKIAKKHGLKVVYDAAHAFDVNFNGRSILSYGDVSTLSFHATKVFNTGEGGGVVVKDDMVFEKLKLLHSFGHIRDEHFIAGINGKNSELHASLGLVNLKYVTEQISQRKKCHDLYIKKLCTNELRFPYPGQGSTKNYSYFPVIFKNEEALLRTMSHLAKKDIFPRRYFYPSLNLLPYVDSVKCPVSEAISNSILCLPLYGDLKLNEVEYISDLVLESL